MPDSILSQSEADALIKMGKHRVDQTQWVYPSSGTISIPLVSSDKREEFLLDIRRSRIDLAKGMYQNRGRQIIALVRLDFGSKPHRNPDGDSVSSPHLHLYKEGFGDKWALPIPESFRNVNDKWQTLMDFMEYCNIITPPIIERGLFI
jgi:hypothetical protein